MSNIIPVSNRNLYPTFISSFDNIFNDFFENSFINTGVTDRRLKSASQVPMANISETEGGYEIDLAAPGMARDNFNITVENNTLTISGKNSDQKKGTRRAEFNYGEFKRAWSLPKGVNAEQISANYEAGILNISIPTEKKKKHKVNINID